jgi:hypothetical protein
LGWEIGNKLGVLDVSPGARIPGNPPIVSGMVPAFRIAQFPQTSAAATIIARAKVPLKIINYLPALASGDSFYGFF